MTGQLTQRLTLPKWLFSQGKEVLRRPGRLYAGGLATSHFHDSIETFCHVLAESQGISNLTKENFDGILKKISEMHPHVQGHAASLSRLNKARVGFKHNGILVTMEDAVGFERTTHAFLSETSHKVWEIDFDQLSMIDVIGHRRTENHLHAARDSLQQNELEKSVEHSAKAFAVLMHHHRQANRFPPSRGCTFTQAMDRTVLRHIPSDSQEYRNPLWHMGTLLESEFRELSIYMEVLGSGIDLSKYHAFQSLVPLAQMMTNNSVVVTKSRAERKYMPVVPDLMTENAEFCIDFVIEAALCLNNRTAFDFLGAGAGKTPLQAIFERRGAVRRGVATRACDVVVWPEGDSVEVIRRVDPNEAVEIVADSGLPGQEVAEYLSILQDGELAFVRKECVSVAERIGKKET